MVCPDIELDTVREAQSPNSAGCHGAPHCHSSNFNFFLEIMHITYLSQWITSVRNHGRVTSDLWKQSAESVLTGQWSAEQRSPKWGACVPGSAQDNPLGGRKKELP